MADFNKQDVKDVGNIQPTGYSKPISDVRDFAGQYGAAAIAAGAKGVNDLVEGVPKLIDTLFTQQAKAEGEEFGKAMYNAYTNKLENLSKLPGSQQPSITNAEAPAAPDELVQAGDALAKANDALQYTKPGTPLQTLYLAQITKGAKELNDRWGGANGYGDIVDHQIEKATGWNPNKYVQQLIAGINQNATNAQKEPNQVRVFLESMMHKGQYQAGSNPQTNIYASDVLTKYQSGQWTAQQVYDWGSRVSAVDADMQRRKSIQEIDKSDRSVVHEVYEGLATREIATMIHKDIDKMSKDMGLVPSGQQLETWVNNVLIKGKEALADPTQAVNVQQALMARMNMIKSLANQEGNRPQFFMPGADRNDPNQKQSYIQMLGPGGATKWNTIIKDQTDYMQNLINALAKGETAIAQTAAVKSTIAIDGAKEDLLTGNGKNFWLAVAAGNAVGGPNFSERFMQDQLVKQYGPAWVTDMVKDQTFGFVHQRSWTLGEKSSPDTVKWAVDRAMALGVKSPEAYKDLVKSVNQITDPRNTDDVKANQMYASFHPDNYGLVSKFRQQGDVYKLMTTPEITKEAWRLGKKDPRLWEMYDAWFKNSYSEVAGSALREANKLAGDMEWLHIGYDTKNMKWETKPDTEEFYRTRHPERGGRAAYSPDPFVQRAQNAVDELNKAQTGFKSFAETSDSDVNSYMYGVLKGIVGEGTLADNFRKALRNGIKAETAPAPKAPQSPTNGRTEGKTAPPTPNPSEILHFSQPEVNPAQAAFNAAWNNTPAANRTSTLGDDVLHVEYGPIEVTRKDGTKFQVEGTPENIDKYFTKRSQK
jgi:hypothetical protein